MHQFSSANLKVVEAYIFKMNSNYKATDMRIAGPAIITPSN